MTMAEQNETRPDPGLVRDFYDLVTGDEDARVCRDISEAACRDQPVNFFVHLPALVANKAGDLLASPKLVLPWLLAAAGAPLWFMGWLVPLREALALLPQLAVADWIRRVPVRKWFWVAGAAVQGISVLTMAAAAMLLGPSAGGATVLGLLAVFALGRGVCSVAYKDVQGKTIAKTRRGTLSGYAASAGGGLAVALGIGLWLAPDHIDGTTGLATLLVVAGVLWLAAALIFAGLREAPGATEGGGNALATALTSLTLVRQRPAFGCFVTTRGLLLATALAAPFYASLAHQASNNLRGFALMLGASGLASLFAAPLWGRAADRSARRVMAAAGLAAALLHLIATGLAAAGSPVWAYAAAFFALSALHAGVRLGRKTYLVDLAPHEDRAAYTAVSKHADGRAAAGGWRRNRSPRRVRRTGGDRRAGATGRGRRSAGAQTTGNPVSAIDCPLFLALRGKYIPTSGHMPYSRVLLQPITMR